MQNPTRSMNVVISWLKRMAIPLNSDAAFILQMEGAFKDEENLYHRVEVGICNTVGENQAAELRSSVVGVVDVDVAPS